MRPYPHQLTVLVACIILIVVSTISGAQDWPGRMISESFLPVQS